MYIYSPNSFMLKGFWRFLYYWPGCAAAISGAVAINFCAQAAEIVMVASLPSTRNGHSFHFRQKNTMVLAYFTSRVVWLPRWTPGGPAASQMPPRCFPDASQMPPRCFPMPPRCLSPQ